MSEIIAVVHNDVSPNACEDERDVLDQAQMVAEAVAALGSTPQIIPFGADLTAMGGVLGGLRPRVVFNLVEAVNGVSRLQHLAPLLYERLGLPYTGATAEAIFITTNKTLAKRWMALAGVPTPAWLEMGEPGRGRGRFPGRYLIKAVSEDASVGLDASAIVDVSREEELVGHVLQRQRLLGKPCFAEEFIEGREFNLSLMGSRLAVEVMPPAEMTFNFPEGLPRIMDYKAKWVEGTVEYENTRRTFALRPGDEGLVEELCLIARRCWDIFGLSGYARVDFRVDQEGRPYVLEVNANPCLSEGSGFPVACQQGGISYEEMIGRIIAEAKGRAS